MAYTEKELNRMVELYQSIEDNKEHENAAPGYKDTNQLKEIAEIVQRHKEIEVATLEETIPALWYLTECYDKMGRAGMSVKFYTSLLKMHTQLMKLRLYTDEDMEHLYSDFYSAVKARNYYEQDNCDDLIETVSEIMTKEKIYEIVYSVKENCAEFIKNDPIEKTDKYLEVIDEVERKIDENKTMDFCLEYWNLKSTYLLEYGICWRSPAQLNPRVMFD